MATTETTLRRTCTDRHNRPAVRWMGCAGATLCLTFAIAVNAAPGNGSRGDGMGTQGPADSTQMQAQGQAQMPGQMQSQNGNCTPDTPSDQAIVGKSLTEAKTMLQGCPWRIGMQDGKAMPTTRDYRPDRRTLTIENDKVTSVTRG
ncbi:hypothetical protein PI93_010040 [Pandoraea fibrosis]|uniref:Peptidase inhibitor I78 family protein n=1 Tax=Pandoraea fibrosis TaxID=1891094 RepID=A0ABX6HPV9_9BURK|nr:hypothetical protein [Pandoraea fibrosis]QHE93502.1 hypothetical protein PJ20_017955 [Pandoraea fibrosis]QHF12936.1 hypothetical protein PI93_010040 [Pandoraea fibrosis]